jgi:3-deoxy-manno-octulosonate cytidylyltransferase (CMP-KDO synthetase)
LAAVAIIPARFGSTRFPGKIVACDTGKPLVQHVVERARKARHLRDIIVATDDRRIIDCLRPFGTTCVLTSPSHQSGTDRIAEVARGLADTIVVNIQGDEPEIDAQTIDDLILHLEDTGDDMATAATAFPPGADPNDPNLVKVVVGLDGTALYFSRSAIPFDRDAAQRASRDSSAKSNGGSTEENQPTYYLHQGIYAYRREFLLTFASWDPTPLEQIEKLEQLRVLEHGRAIHVLMTTRAVHGIDTPQQYEEFVKRFKEVAH